MKKKQLTRRLALLAITFLLIAFIGCTIGAVATILEDPEQYYVPQGSAMCGYTAFYMMLKYYGDHEKITEPSYQETIKFPNKVEETSKVVTNIRANDNNYQIPTMSGLEASADSVYYYDANNQRLKLYNTVLLNKDHITRTDRTSREARFKNEVYSYLLNGRPILIYLDRDYWLASGHFIVLIGMELAEDEEGNLISDENGDPVITDIYYMDPYMVAADFMRKKTDDGSIEGWSCEAATENFGSDNPNFDKNYDTCFVQKINYDVFMNGSWYLNGSSTSYGYKAYWDGKYLIFEH